MNAKQPLEASASPPSKQNASSTTTTLQKPQEEFIMVNNKPIRPLAKKAISSPSDKIMSPCSKKIAERRLHGQSSAKTGLLKESFKNRLKQAMESEE